MLVHNCPPAGDSSISISSDDFDAVWAKVPGSGDYARAERAGGTLSVTDVFRVDQEAVRGSDLVAAVLYAHRVKSGEIVVISNIINQQTVAAFNRGDPASISLLGRTGASALGKLGLSPKSIDWYPSRGKLNIAITVG